VGCCLAGCLRLVAFTLWRAIFAALLALLLTRIDSYVDRSGKSESLAGRAWRLYRSRSGRKVRRGTPRDAGSAIDTEGGPRT
jgi:hypothetical protein